MVSSHILWPVLGVFKKICNVFLLYSMKNHHNHHINFYIRVLPMSHSMGLAVPGYAEHLLSKHFCLVGQPRPGHNHCHSLDTFRPCLSKPSFPSGTGKWKVCDRFDTGRSTLYKSIPSQSPAAKNCCNILNAKFLRMFQLGFWGHRSSRSWCGHCGGAALGLRCSDPTFRYHGA